eukprot:5653698-Amphidinium_carterae.1
MKMRNSLKVRITWSPLPGRAPSKLLTEISKTTTALIVRMPLLGSVPLKPFLSMWNSLKVRITWSPLPGSAPLK